MAEIPINPADLPVETEPLPDDITYEGTISNVGGVAVDKNGNDYFGIKIEITQPEEWKGRVIGDNYIALPRTPDPDMDARQRRRALESGVRLGRLCRSAKFNPGARPWDTDELVGQEVTFTVRNDEYQGRLVPKVNDYLI